SFSVSGSTKNLEVKLSGNNFPEPDNTDGSIQNGDVEFDLTPGDGGTTDLATFKYSGTGYTSGNFRFENIPQGSYSGSLSGETKNYDVGGDFGLTGLTLTADSAGGNKKSLGLKAHKKPSVSQNYEVNSFALNQVTIDGILQIAAVMEVSQSTTTDLEATCEDLIDFSEMNNPLPLVIKNKSDNDELDLIGRVYISD
ncbi:MAG: hypothetical protein ACPF9D_12160, partial [Owenweeksia sp.]